LVLILVETIDGIASKGSCILRLVPVDFECVPIETVQPFRCTQPDKTVLILNSGYNSIGGKSIFYLIMPEISRLGEYMQRQDMKGDQQGRSGSSHTIVIYYKFQIWHKMMNFWYKMKNRFF